MSASSGRPKRIPWTIPAPGPDGHSLVLSASESPSSPPSAESTPWPRSPCVQIAPTASTATSSFRNHKGPQTAVFSSFAASPCSSLPLRAHSFSGLSQPYLVWCQQVRPSLQTHALVIYSTACSACRHRPYDSIFGLSAVGLYPDFACCSAGLCPCSCSSESDQESQGQATSHTYDYLPVAKCRVFKTRRRRQTLRAEPARPICATPSLNSHSSLPVQLPKRGGVGSLTSIWMPLTGA